MLRHGHIVVVQLLLAGQGEAGGDDGQHVRAQLLSPLAHVDGVGGGDAAGPGVDGDTALDLIDDGFQNLFLLLQAENVALAVGAEGEQAVDAAGEQPLHLVAQLLMIDGLVVIAVHGGQNGRNDAFDLAVFHDVTLLMYFSFSLGGSMTLPTWNYRIS